LQRIVKLPDIGEGTTEAEIVSWLVKVGDTVEEDDPLAEVMTDKATVEVPSPVAGTIVALNGNPGEKLAVGSDLVVLETEAGAVADPHPPAATQPVSPLPRAGEGKTSAPILAAPAKPARASLPLSRNGKENADPGEGRGSAGEGQRTQSKPLASPAVRQQAWDLGIELQFVPGTGPGGRVTHQDLEAYAAGGRQPAATSAPSLSRREGVEDIPVTGLRRAIAEHMEAAREIPRFGYVEEIDVTGLEELRAHLNQTRAGRGHLTLLPFLMRAIINAMVEYPQVNARYDAAAGILHRHRAVHLGVATQTPGGLMVPVIRHAEALDLWQAAAEVNRLAEAARAGKATREELAGSTITLTSLGPLGGLVATPVINHPEVAIVGVNRIDERPVARGGQVVIRKMMNLSSSFDHRIVDGWEAASFIAKVKGYLEQPATLFID
jgi:2-oxoisovalerate dehydrogenase E2 component (dihydrolipoyl transacylase)